MKSQRKFRNSSPFDKTNGLSNSSLSERSRALFPF